MLQSQSNWKFTYKEAIGEGSDLEQQSLSSLTERLLMQRGITSSEEVEKFLHPSLDNLIDPSHLHDIDKAAERVHLAIERGEKILVFGDYDADGVSSTSVLMEALRELHAMCDFYIPNRFTEGYGPNEKAFREAHQSGYQLIITVDNGIAAFEEADLAKELGIDLIITDHHEVQEKLPNAFAIIHPKCSDNYAFKELAGVGVAFKFAERLLGYFPNHLLDLVVIGTIADLVPLVSENRILAYHGLKALTNSKRPGVQALKKICKIDGKVTEEDIGFLIGPRLNAVGRLQDADPAVDLLLTDDPDEAEELASFIQELNQERQKIVSDITKEAEQLVKDESEGNECVIVVAKEGWNEGVLGIVASKLVRTYQKPAIVLSINEEKGHAKGSARSIDAFDLFSNCMQIKDTFIHFGGHAQAAGMTLAKENVTVLRQKLNQMASDSLTDADYKQSLLVDATIKHEELDVNLVKEIEKLAPFGMGNPKPLFHIQSPMKEIRQIGSQQNHLKIMFHEDQHVLDGIGFGMGDVYPFIAPHSIIDAVGELQVNEWNGMKKVQLLLKDLAVSEWQLFDYRGSKRWHNQLSHTSYDTTLAVSFQAYDQHNLPVESNYFSFVDRNIKELNGLTIKELILLDLPTTLEQLDDMLQVTKPERIYACYQVNDSQFFSSVPNREDFKWFYAMLIKRKQFDLKKDTPKLANHKGWKPEKIKFIIDVFSELDFVRIENNTILPNANPSKKDLTESTTYQHKLHQSDIEAKLYYTNYHELKSWMSRNMDEVSSVKEEVSYGL
ncbi:single-stranded-DNA-specific exonuclease RecJ [Aquibacillus koreensis]|uniref:Single-stranded-DNA-specific exonuclease RecJ n=1 Tax=Aquibacillus koreensis TaxID=279446 RepID=A0A9X3WKM9_9BACI|nr:single-stranded-DNA-specific exonuclease RecJ [Aquibacillus koreensis]MCT2537995.1 single-stranded-DNA-specific exonuclease RecJ [Aquibacillus koreensis]MDC3419114.1 single-stranded-DNA-specific exonuclease RecJ [Aquibacillus koreensis]